MTCSYRRQVDKLKDVWLSCELTDSHDGLHRIEGLEWYSVDREMKPAGDGKQQEARVDIAWVQNALEYAGEGRANTIKPDLLANAINKHFARQATQPITQSQLLRQPSHASGEPTQQAHQLALDTIDRLQDERDTAFQRGVQAMAEKAAQLLLRIRNQMTDIVERERYNNIANQILDLPGRSLAGTEPQPFDWKAEGYVCAALHRVPISHCKDCDDAAGAVEPPQDKLSALVAKWRKIIAECPDEHKGKWVHVFDAVNTWAKELERSLAGAEPRQDKREVLPRCGCGRQLIWQNEERRCMICPHCVTERLMLAQRMLGKTVVLAREPGASERK